MENRPTLVARGPFATTLLPPAAANMMVSYPKYEMEQLA